MYTVLCKCRLFTEVTNSHETILKSLYLYLISYKKLMKVNNKAVKNLYEFKSDIFKSSV